MELNLFNGKIGKFNKKSSDTKQGIKSETKDEYLNYLTSLMMSLAGSTLERNINRLRIKLNTYADKRKIAIIGQPGSGKSTLLDILTFNKLVPRPKIGQRTDVTDWSQDPNIDLMYFYQNYIFVDVPGFNTSTHPVESIINLFPFEHFNSILFVINGKVHLADNMLWQTIKNKQMESRTLIIRSFSDGLDQGEEKEVRADLKSHFGKECILVSNRKKTGFDEIMYFLNR